jgi:hypothetical protein
MAGYLSADTVAAIEKEIMIRRGDRAKAADLAKADAAASAPPPADRVPILYGDQPLTPQQVADFASTLRSTYAAAGYDDDLIALKEAKLLAYATQAGATLPPLPRADREKLLLARHAAKVK